MWKETDAWVWGGLNMRHRAAQSQRKPAGSCNTFILIPCRSRSIIMWMQLVGRSLPCGASPDCVKEVMPCCSDEWDWGSVSFLLLYSSHRSRLNPPHTDEFSSCQDTLRAFSNSSEETRSKQQLKKLLRFFFLHSHQALALSHQKCEQLLLPELDSIDQRLFTGVWAWKSVTVERSAQGL